MSTIDLTIPSPGESITEVTLGPWRRKSGEFVQKDEPLVEIESDKVTLEVVAPADGVLEIAAESGQEMKVGDRIGAIQPGAQAGAVPRGNSAPALATRVEVATATASSAAPARATPLARKVAAETGVNLASVPGTGPSGRVTRGDVLAAGGATRAGSGIVPAPAVATAAAPSARSSPVSGGELAIDPRRRVRREKMSKLRQRVAQRLVEAQHTAAMLTTFNEVDMTEIMRLRAAHKEAFTERHGIGLGFMGFFIKACVSALQAFPGVNAFIAGDEVEYHDFVDVSVAVGTPRGLVVPILRSAETLSIAQIELAIKDLATRARDGKLTLDDMTGGTFTISNGGVYGSLMSTPILNPPQSGILGMHKIMNRAVEDPRQPGAIALRPMMYLALSYDHRIVDGEQAVKFLVHCKGLLESPERLLLGL